VTNEQLAEQMAALAKVQAETLKLMGRESERRDDEMSELRRGQIELREAQMATERALTRLSDAVERFITRGGNGR
jgi:hypothetical protein